MNAKAEAPSICGALVEVWECSGCERHHLAVRYGRGVWLEHEVTGALEYAEVAPGGWRLARGCRLCGGVVSLLYAHAALTRSGRLIVFRDRGVGNVPSARIC